MTGPEAAPAISDAEVAAVLKEVLAADESQTAAAAPAAQTQSAVVETTAQAAAPADEQAAAAQADEQPSPPSRPPAGTARRRGGGARADRRARRLRAGGAARRPRLPIRPPPRRRPSSPRRARRRAAHGPGARRSRRDARRAVGARAGRRRPAARAGGTGRRARRHHSGRVRAGRPGRLRTAPAASAAARHPGAARRHGERAHRRDRRDRPGRDDRRAARRCPPSLRPTPARWPSTRRPSRSTSLADLPVASAPDGDGSGAPLLRSEPFAAATGSAGTGERNEQTAYSDVAAGAGNDPSTGSTELVTATQTAFDPSLQPWSARGPPSGATLVAASVGGIVTAGDATLTFAPGFLAADAYVRVTPLSAPYAFELEAWDAATGQEIHSFLVAPVLQIRTGTLPVAPQIVYVDPAGATSPVASVYDPAAGTISAALPHFSTYAANTPPASPGPWLVTMYRRRQRDDPDPERRRHRPGDRAQRDRGRAAGHQPGDLAR